MVRKSKEELTILIESIFLLSGASENTAKRVTEALVSSSLAGVDSHGIWQIIRYSNDLKIKDYNGTSDPTIISETSSTATISGHWNFGHLGAKLAIETAIKKAKNTTIALVGLIQAGHIGRLGAWSEMAALKNCVSITFVNTSGFGILMAPHGGTDRRLSANPIAIGVPIENNDYLVLDMATSIIAEGKIKVAKNKKIKLPEEYLLDGYGNPTNDPEKFYSEPVSYTHLTLPTNREV